MLLAPYLILNMLQIVFSFRFVLFGMQMIQVKNGNLLQQLWLCTFVLLLDTKLTWMTPPS